jgi:HSP20 family protein
MDYLFIILKGGHMTSNALSKKIERLPSIFDDFFRPWNDIFRSNEGWERLMTVPAVNITDSKDYYNLSLAAPGLKKNDFKIDVEGNILTISTEKEQNKEEKTDQFTRREYSYSSFSRSFTLPEEVNKEKIEAAYEDGLLKVSLPKKEEARKLATSKHISVK